MSRWLVGWFAALKSHVLEDDRWIYDQHEPFISTSQQWNKLNNYCITGWRDWHRIKSYSHQQTLLVGDGLSPMDSSHHVVMEDHQYRKHIGNKIAVQFNGRERRGSWMFNCCSFLFLSTISNYPSVANQKRSDSIEEEQIELFCEDDPLTALYCLLQILTG